MLNKNDIWNELIQFLKLEVEANEKEAKEKDKRSIEAKIAAGDLLALTRFEDISEERKPKLMSSTLPQSKLIVHWDKNDSKFGIGNSVILYNNDPDFCANYEIVDVETNCFELTNKAYVGPGFGKLKNKQPLYLTKDKFDPTTKLLEVVESLKVRNIQGVSFNVLETKQAAHFHKDKLDQYLKNAPTALNESQQQAYAKACASTNYFFIQGPPGTGKTNLLAHIVNQLALEGKEIAVMGFTNLSINLALNKIIALAGKEKIQRLGSHSMAKWEGSVLTSSDNYSRGKKSIFGLTAYSVQKTIEEGNFQPYDVVIFDEASQMNLAQIAVGMAMGRKAIFIGDPAQMGPIIKAPLVDEQLNQSIFHYMATAQNTVMLEETYRMNTALTAFPSQEFYKGLLRPAAANAARCFSYSATSSIEAEIFSPKHSAVFLDIPQHDARSVSELESLVVAKLVAHLMSQGVDPNHMAVLSPFNAQRNQIVQQIKTLFAANDLKKNSIPMVNTIDKMQGQEREVVFVSFAASEFGYMNEIADFFFSPQRLNVAVTRAKTKLILLGNAAMWNPDLYPPSLSAQVALYHRYQQQCHNISLSVNDIEKLGAGNTLRFPFLEQLKSILQKIVNATAPK